MATWRELFNKDKTAGYDGCEIGDVIVINMLCVNPFMICVYVPSFGEGDRLPTKLYRIFGDIWFLQPLLKAFFQVKQWGVSLKRCTPVQSWYKDDMKRLYLQDILYLSNWASFIGLEAQ